MCDCKDIEIGSYKNQTILFSPQGKLVGIDRCVSNKIKKLWDSGIITIESCCGHNKTEGYIAVENKSIEKMKELGFTEIKPNIFRLK